MEQPDLWNVTEPAPPAQPESPSITLEDRVLAWISRPAGPSWSKKRVRDAAFRFNSRVARQKGWPPIEWVRDQLVPAAIEAAGIPVRELEDGGQRPRDHWPDPELLLAKAWWESRWDPTRVGQFRRVNGRIVRGVGGEVGVMQIKPAICRRYLGDGDRARLYPALAAIPATIENCAETKTNLLIAATILREHLAACDGRPRYALTYYGSGQGCAPPPSSVRTVFVWAQQIREVVPPDGDPR